MLKPDRLVPHHPLTEIFPSLDGADFEALKVDIGEHGQRQPILIHKGTIIDGRARYRACMELGIEPNCREWQGRGSIIDAIVSFNLIRRHLNESQRAMVAARLAEQPSMEVRQGRPKNSADLRYFRGKRSQRAACVLNVGTKTVELAQRVLRIGAAELVRSVDRGELAVTLAAAAATMSKSEQRRLLRKGERAIRDALRDRERSVRMGRIEKDAAAPLSSLGRRRYAVIYADPPYRYDFAPSDSRAIENHYQTMTADELAALPVGEIAAEDSVLFLWATPPKLAEAIDLIRGWGFEYVTDGIWDKIIQGMGFYFRLQHEHLLLAKRGNPPTPPPAARPSSVIRAKRGQHSQKPDCVYGDIDRMYPGVAKIELFARGAGHRGWAVWGDQARPEVRRSASSPRREPTPNNVSKPRIKRINRRRRK